MDTMPSLLTMLCLLCRPCWTCCPCCAVQVEHLWPANYLLKPWAMGEEFFWETKKGVLSYVIARPMMTLVSVVCNLFGECTKRVWFVGRAKEGVLWVT